MNAPEQRRPLVGVAVIIQRGDYVLLGKRKGSHGSGTWGFVGGHLEFGETMVDCAQREALEEIGVPLRNIQEGTYTNTVFAETQKHYITIYVRAELEEGTEPRITEPDRCESWNWFPWNALPEPLFLPIQDLIRTQPSFLKNDAAR